MKYIFKFLIFLVTTALLIGLIKDPIIKSLIERGVESSVGLKLNIGRLNFGIFKSAIDINDLRLFNPFGFKDQTMIDISDIYIDYELKPLSEKIIHITDASLIVREFVLVRNEKGNFNIFSIKKPIAEKPAGALKEVFSSDEFSGIKFRVDRLRVKIDRGLYKDYSQPGDAVLKEFDIGIDETFENITDFNSIVNIIVAKSMANPDVQNFTKIDMKKVMQVFGNSEWVGGMVNTAGRGVAMMTDTANKTKDTFKVISDVLGGPFGTKNE